MKLKECYSCHKETVIWKNHNGKKYCKACWGCHPESKVTQKPKKQYTIPKVSGKKAKLDRLYTTMRKKFLDLYPICQANLDCCSTKATDIHHKAGRGKFYLDTTTWIAVCRECHTWIELNSEKAKELGLSISRLTKESNEEN
jgi:hypothetical protein